MGNKHVAANKAPAAIKGALARYNMIANVCWSAINLIPLSVFCYRFMSAGLFYPLLIVSLLTALLPHSFLNRMHLSKRANIYHTIGVRFINRFTQNGDIINGLIRKKYPQYKLVSKSKLSVNNLVQQTYRFEKFHLILFVFFTATTIYALINHFFLWAAVITCTNIIYNIYPIFLQQYIRIRLAPFTKKDVL